MAWIVPVLGLVAQVASTGYSVYSGEKASDEAEAATKRERRRTIRAERLAETEAEEARKAERLKRARLGKKQAWLTKGMDLGTASVTTPGLKSTLGA